jgi:hypothetical protein
MGVTGLWEILLQRASEWEKSSRATGAHKPSHFSCHWSLILSGDYGHGHHADPEAPSIMVLDGKATVFRWAAGYANEDNCDLRGTGLLGFLVYQLFALCTETLQAGILPVFIWDGPAPPEKIPTQAKRREKHEQDKTKLQDAIDEAYRQAEIETSDHDQPRDFKTLFQKQAVTKELKTKLIKLARSAATIHDSDIACFHGFLQTLGPALSVKAPGEAEATIAAIAATGGCSVIVTPDSDAFCHGLVGNTGTGPLMIRNIPTFESRKFKTTSIDVVSPQILYENSGTSAEWCRHASLFLQNDYNTVPGDRPSGIGAERVQDLLGRNNHHGNREDEFEAWLDKRVAEKGITFVSRDGKTTTVKLPKNWQWRRLRDLFKIREQSLRVSSMKGFNSIETIDLFTRLFEPSKRDRRYEAPWFVFHAQEEGVPNEAIQRWDTWLNANPWFANVTPAGTGFVRYWNIEIPHPSLIHPAPIRTGKRKGQEWVLTEDSGWEEQWDTQCPDCSQVLSRYGYCIQCQSDDTGKDIRIREEMLILQDLLQEQQTDQPQTKRQKLYKWTEV